MTLDTEQASRLQAEITTALASANRIEIVTGLHSARDWYARLDCQALARKFRQIADNMERIGTRTDESV